MNQKPVVQFVSPLLKGWEMKNYLRVQRKSAASAKTTD